MVRAPADATDLIPVTVGTTWTYEVTTRPLRTFDKNTYLRTDTMSVSITGSFRDPVDGQPVQVWTYSPRYLGLSGYLNDVAWVRVRQPVEGTPHTIVQVWSPEGETMPVFVYDTTIGDTLRNQLRGVTLRGSGDTTITVPAGRFAGCRAMYGRQEGMLSGCSHRTWLKPGIGVVYATQNAFSCLSATEMTWRLISFHIAPPQGFGLDSSSSNP